MASLPCGTTPTLTVEERFEVVYSAVANICERKELQINSTRANKVKQLSNDLVSTLQAPGAQELFKVFASRLYQQLCSLLNFEEPITMVKLQERMWIQYAHQRATLLPKLWHEFLQQVNCPACLEEPMLAELVNETVLEQIIKQSFPLNAAIAVNEPSPMSKDEGNILQYACGFVAMKLKKRFLKSPCEKSARFIECLRKMEMDGPESSFYD